VMGSPRPGRKVVLTGDTAPTERVEAIAHGADLLVHEATFLDDDAERAHETQHTTAIAAARLAAAAEVKMLALTHVSPRYSGGELRDEARTVFANTIVPRDFDSVEIPLPERGPAIHHREALRSGGQQQPL
jgi:ribonuclease Z